MKRYTHYFFGYCPGDHPLEEEGDYYKAEDVHKLVDSILKHEQRGLIEFESNGSAALLLKRLKRLRSD